MSQNANHSQSPSGFSAFIHGAERSQDVVPASTASAALSPTGTRSKVTFLSRGYPLDGILQLPAATEQPVPAALFFHGMGGNKIGRSRCYVDLAEQLADAGIASLRFDFFGAGESSGSFSEMTVSTQRADALAAFQWLQNHPSIDATRIALYGRSFGGAIATLTAAARCREVASLALWAPFFHGEEWAPLFAQLNKLSITERINHPLLYLQGQRAGYQLIEEIFSIDIASALRTISHMPLLHIHGELDRVVPYSHAHHYIQARQQIAPMLSRFVRLPTDHDFSSPELREQATNETIRWFIETLHP